MHIELDDPDRPDVRALLEEHLRDMHDLSPPESVHALDVTKLKDPDITFWTVRDGTLLLGCGALKQLDAEHGEVKSMRAPVALRGRGAGRAVLAHIIRSMKAFAPAQRLYESFEFRYCEPFGDYRSDPNSVFMTLRL